MCNYYSNRVSKARVGETELIAEFEGIRDLAEAALASTRNKGNQS